ncbi:MAG: hypothetical protein K2L07_10675 [Lachnospiraceae bacterium]|nr:hypothetical protein [Lachnospiraceae bacterium]
MSDVIDMLTTKIADFCKYTGEFKVNGNENYQIKFVYDFLWEPRNFEAIMQDMDL